ncbi:tryptophan-rich sensory protein [Micrococcus luteus]
MTTHVDPSRAGSALDSTVGRIVTAVVVVAALIGMMVGMGLFGGVSVFQAVGGWLGEDATWLSTKQLAGYIWVLIYAGFVGYAVWQLMTPTPNARHDRLRPWILTGIALNIVWLGFIEFGVLWGGVAVSLAQLAVLLRILVLMEQEPARSWCERIAVDCVQGFYLGWLLFSVFRNGFAGLASNGWNGGPFMPTTWAVVAIVVITVLSALLSAYDGGRLCVVLPTAWGLFWVGVGRSDGDGLQSGAVAVTAFGCAAVVLLAWAGARWLAAKSPTGEARDLIADALDGDGQIATR